MKSSQVSIENIVFTENRSFDRRNRSLYYTIDSRSALHTTDGVLLALERLVRARRVRSSTLGCAVAVASVDPSPKACEI